ncbi:proteasome alpha subunit c6 [Tubulinosema ratisbonensis]|uniref:Proteasome alpha subunit c6 n=1 Tax=Tubulinosema ratisbonensis TaxID=291195 RepID=A0A437AL05_9MICR|nr:proteasome alpha subunit c6 [Tubulinosema ratisbonensis]
MNDIEQEIFCIFNKEGKILQVEYALEALNGSNPVVIGRNKNSIVCATKKIFKSKLLDEQPTNIFKITNTIYGASTGLHYDVDNIIIKAKEIHANREYELGIEVTPDILSLNIADKAQKVIQESGSRPLCFSLALFGFDNNIPSIYYTDVSAIHYPYYALGMGIKNGRVNSFLEKNYNVNLNDSELQEVITEGLLQAIGEDVSPNDISVYVLERGLQLKEFTNQEVDLLLQRVADK